MGIDFIRKATKSFVKAWDNGRRELATADLFTSQPEPATRTAAFMLLHNGSLCAGDSVVVEADGTALVARHGLGQVARADNPPPALLEAVRNSCGIAQGTVQHIHTIAGTAEISLC